MNTKQFIEEMNTQNKIEIGSKAFELMHELSQEALQLTMELNNKYHTPEEIVEITCRLNNRCGMCCDKRHSCQPYCSWKSLRSFAQN